MISHFIRLILGLIFFIEGTMTLKATDLYFFEGLDNLIQAKLSSKNYPSALYYSPSLRFSERERIKNGRILGNYGQWKPDFPVHFQAISFDNGINFCPQDSISSILQLLFPSPGRIDLQPNQTISDSITSVSFKHLGRMSCEIEEWSMASGVEQNEQTLRDVLYQLFPGEAVEGKKNFFDASTVSLEECINHYKAFLAYDFKKNLALYVAKLLNGVSGEDLEDENFSQDDPNKYTKALKSIENNKLFERELIKDNEIEEYILYWNLYTQFKAFNGKKLTAAQVADIDNFKVRYKDELFLEENKAQFKKFIFVETLVQALSQQNDDEGTYSYPAFIVQRALMTYFWMKAKDESDIAEWFSGFLDVSSDEIIPHIQSRFSLTNYEPWKLIVLEKSPESEEILSSSEKLALLAFGYQLFDAVLPPSIPYGTAKYKGNPFANCVEMSCFNFLRFISRQKSEQGYEQDIGIFPATSLAYKIFKQHSDPSSHFLPEAHNEWATMLSARKGVIYCKPGTAPREKRMYEVKAGIMNILNCLKLVLADSPADVSLIRFEEGEEAIEEAIAGLNQTSAFKAELEEPLKNEELQDYFGDLTFSVNGKKSFIWHVTAMHSDIEVCEDVENDWRKTVPTEQFLSTPSLREISPQFLNLDFLREQITHLSPSELSSFFYGVDVRPLKTKLTLIELIFRNQLRSLENFARSLMMSIVNLQDYYPNQQLFMLLISLSTGDNLVLTNEQMDDIISRYPSLMTAGIHEEKFGHLDAAIWAYKNNKKEWIKCAASHIYGLNILEEPTDYEDFISTFSQLKNLEHLSLSGVIKLPKFFPLLEKLRSFSISIYTSGDLSNIVSSLDYLTSSFKKLSCQGSLHEKEFRNLIEVFFTKIPTGKLQFNFWNSYDEEPQNLAQAKERLQAFAADKGISQEQLELSHQ